MRSFLIHLTRWLPPWVRTRWGLIIAAIGVCVVIGFVIFESRTHNDPRTDILFLVQVSSLVILVLATRATQQATKVAQQATQVSQGMLAEQRAARKLQELQSAPYIAVYPEVDGFLVNLVIENAGPTWARRVKVSFEPPLRPSQKIPGGIPPFFRGEEFSLGPGKRIKFLLDDTYRFPLSFSSGQLQKALVSYQGARTEEPYCDTIPLDFSGYFKQLEAEYVPETPIDAAVDKLDRIERALQGMVRSVDGLSSQLESGPLMSAGITDGRFNPLDFAGLVHELSAVWSLWRQERPAPPPVRRTFERRLRALIEETLRMAPFLPLPAADAPNARLLLMRLLAVFANPHWGLGQDDEAIGTYLAELARVVEGPPDGELTLDDSGPTAHN